METNRVIIAGGRDFNDYDLLRSKADLIAIDTVVCGMAKGADALGYRYAQELKLGIKKFPAEWDHFGKRAGPIRNAQMGDYADMLLAFWDGKSRGTAHMIDYMNKKGKQVIVVSY